MAAAQRERQLNWKDRLPFDPKLATILPGNEKTRREQAEKEFRRFEKMLERILPEKRRKELGLEAEQTSEL